MWNSNKPLAQKKLIFFAINVFYLNKRNLGKFELFLYQVELSKKGRSRQLLERDQEAPWKCAAHDWHLEKILGRI